MKWKIGIALLVLLTTADCGYDSNNQPSDYVDLTTALEMFNVAFQSVMPCGYPPQKIPKLAPYTLPRYAFNNSNQYYNLTGQITNLIITGLNNFYFLNFDHNLTTNNTYYDLIFAEIQLVGEYELDYTTTIIGFPVHMTAKGLLDTKIVDFRTVGDFQLTPNPYNTNGLRVSNLNFHFFLGDFVSNNWNYGWNIAANNFFNRWLSAFVLEWAEQIQDKVNRIYAQLVLPIVNGYLFDVSINQFINYAVEESMVLTMANCTTSQSA